DPRLEPASGVAGTICLGYHHRAWQLGGRPCRASPFGPAYVPRRLLTDDIRGAWQPRPSAAPLPLVTDRPTRRPRSATARVSGGALLATYSSEGISPCHPPPRPPSATAISSRSPMRSRHTTPRSPAP